MTDGDIIAHSPNPLDILEYCNGRSDRRRINMIKLTDKERIERVINTCGSLSVESVGSVPGTLDLRGNSDLYEHASEEYDKLQFLIKDLKNIEDNYSIGDEDKKILKKARKLLKQLSKPDNFRVATGFEKTEAISRQGDAKEFRKLTK